MKKRIILAASIAAMLTLAGCSNEEVSNTRGDALLGTPILLSDISVAGSGSAVSRYDANAPGNSTIVNPWQAGDKVLVEATPIGQEQTVQNYYTYQTDGTWKQNSTDAIGSTYAFLTVETVASLNSFTSYGGQLTDDTGFANGDTEPIKAEQYAQRDYLSKTYTDADKPTVSQSNHTFSVELSHKRADFAFKVYDGEGNGNTLKDDGTPALSISVKNKDADATTTYFTWNTGKFTEPEDALTNAGKTYTLFRTILPPECKVDGATLYADENTPNGIQISLTGNDKELEMGKRYTATVTYTDYKKLNANVTVSDWIIEAGGELGTVTIPENGYTHTEGTDATPGLFTVYNAEGLANVSSLINTGQLPGAKTRAISRANNQYANSNIVLNNDIVMTKDANATFTPIGGSEGFNGSFAGNGMTISGLNVTNSVEVSNGSNASKTTVTGLIGKLNSTGNVSGITLADATIGDTVTDGDGTTTTSTAIAGAIVGKNEGTVSNCSLTGNSSVSGTTVGGIVGENTGANANVEACAVDGASIVSTNSNSTEGSTETKAAGGIVGNNTGGTVTGSSVSGTTVKNQNETEGSAAGGIVGSNEGGTISESIVEDIKVNASSGKDTDTGLTVGTSTGGTVTEATDNGSNKVTAVKEVIVEGEGFTYSSIDGFIVTTGTGLANVSQLANNASEYLSADITLANDIDMTNVEYYPLGAFEPYTGTFDGDGKRISNLSIAQETGMLALIGFLGTSQDFGVTATVRNLTLHNVTISQSRGMCAFLVSWVYSGTITNCHITGNSRIDCGWSGGLVNRFEYGSITNCTLTGAQIIGESAAGGIATNIVQDGFEGPAKTLIDQCIVTDCTISSSDPSLAGGIAGYAGEVETTITNCTVRGTVDGKMIVTGKANETHAIAGNWADDYEGNASNTVINVTINSESGSVNTPFEGEGYVYDTTTGFTITTGTGLANVSQMVINVPKYLGTTITLANDIEMSATDNKNYIPMGNYEYPFTGIFDGNGKVIRNLNLSGNECVGLFGNLCNPDNGGTATVKNLTLENVTLTDNTDTPTLNFTAFLVGFMNSGTISNCHITGNSSIKGCVPGGIVGRIANGTISDCTVTGARIEAIYEDGIGGITASVQQDDGNGYVTITDCTVSGCTINGLTTGNNYTGGIAGYATESQTITNCTVKDTDITGKEGATHAVVGNWTDDFAAASENTVTNVSVTAINGDGFTYEEGTFFITSGEGLSRVSRFIMGQINMDGVTANVGPRTEFLGATISLAADLVNNGGIDMTGKTYIPLGTQANPFTGNFFGNGVTIKNLTINSGYESGLIGYLQNPASGTTACVENIKMENATFTGTNGIVGFIVSRMTNGIVQFCEVNGSNINGQSVGGIAGYCTLGSIIGCNVSNTTISGNVNTPTEAGGIAAFIEGGTVSDCTVTNCTIASTGTTEDHIAGGIAAGALDSDEVTVTDCTVTDCNITGYKTWAKAFIGMWGDNESRNALNTATNVTVNGEVVNITPITE